MRKPRDELLVNALAIEVRARRAALGCSQEELAHRAGLNRTFIGKLELAQAQPSLSVLFDLARALQVRPSDLVESVERRTAKERSSRAR